MIKKQIWTVLALCGVVGFLGSCSGEAKGSAVEGADHPSSNPSATATHSEPAAATQAPNIPGSRSDLVFDFIEKDLGKVYQQHQYDLAFPFVVEGPDPVLLSELDTSCGCTEAKVRPDWDVSVEGQAWPLNKPIPAGSRGAISAVFDASRYRGDKASTITVRGDFLSRKIILGVKADVIPVFVPEPSVVQFGEVLAGSLRQEDPSKTISITAMKDFKIKRWKRVPPGVLIEEVDSAETLDDGRVKRLFKVTAGPDMPEGRMSSSVIAETDLGLDFEFLVNVDVLGAIKYAPATRVAFGVVDHGKAKRRTIKIEATRGAIELPKPSLEFLGAAAKAMRGQVETVVEGKQYVVKITLPKDVAAGSYDGVLRISYPPESGLETKEVLLNARIRQPR